MNVSLIQENQVNEYHQKLNESVRKTINLPDNAIQYYLENWTVNKIKQVLNVFVFLAAWKNNEITGLILGTPPEGGVGTIIWVLVDEKYQGKGIGGALFSKACEIYRTKGAHKLKLTVPDEKTTEFYIKQGMNVEGIHRNHWWNSDFWSMGLIL